MQQRGIMRLVDSINRSRFLSVLADEKTEACQEQLTLCLIHRRKLRSRIIRSAVQACCNGESRYQHLLPLLSLLISRKIMAWNSEEDLNCYTTRQGVSSFG